MAQLHELSALQQGAAVRAGEASPAELVAHYLDRIAAHDATLGAFVTVTADAAHKHAAQLPPGEGRLRGVPTAIKDNIATAGVRTTFGSRAFADFVPGSDAHLVTRVRQAGLISLGKTHTPEFALTPYTDSDIAPSARTPWDTTLSASGSSGGAAAAVAAGLVPVAHGNDGGGSIRTPASACGVFGLKTSRGRISPGPQGIDLFGLSVQGPIARTVADAAALLDVMAGPMPGDPHWAAPLSAGETFVAASRRDPGRLRIARYAHSTLTGTATDPACLAAYEEASSLLERLGHDVEEIEDPFPDRVLGIFRTLWAAHSLRIPCTDESLLRPITRMWRECGRTVTGGELVDAMSDAQTIARGVVERLDAYQAILTPTLATPPQTPDWFTGDGDLAAELDRHTMHSPFAGGANLTGQPSASLPLHWTPRGLPIGVMLTGRPAGEAQLLSLCAQLEAAQPWSHRWPPLYE